MCENANIIIKFNTNTAKFGGAVPGILSTERNSMATVGFTTATASANSKPRAFYGLIIFVLSVNVVLVSK